MKILGGIGALLMLIGTFVVGPTLGIVELIGIIFVLIALYGFAQHFNSRGIFSNAIYGVLAAIVGVVIAGVVAFVTLLTSIKDFLMQVFPGWNGVDWMQLQTMTPDTSNLDPGVLLPILTGFLIILVIVWVFAIIAAFFIRRSLRELAIRSGTGLFATAGLILLIGAVLVILFGLGIILIWIAELILAIAFFTMRHPEPAMAPSQTMPPPASPAPTSV
jgi:uncharacterized membrane protein